MLTGTNKILAAKIANVFCNTDLICNSAVIQRLNFLSDAQFKNILVAYINSRLMTLVTVYRRIYRPDDKVDVFFTNTDIITGDSSNGYVVVPKGKEYDYNYIAQKLGRYNHGYTPDNSKIITTVNKPGGYGIALTTQPAQQDPGQYYVTPQGSLTPGTGGTVPEPAGSGIDTGLLTKAAIAVAAYYFLS
jgi:hypothetical protein